MCVCVCVCVCVYRVFIVSPIRDQRKINWHVGYLNVCHPFCVKSIIKCIYCVYIYTYMQSKTTVCQVISLCVACYIVVPPDKLLCFWLHVHVNIHIMYTLYYRHVGSFKMWSCWYTRCFSVGDTLPHTVVGVCCEFQRTGRFLQRGIWSQCVVPRSAVPSVRSAL